MRLLFELKTGDFDPDGTAFVRPSVRAVIRQEGRVLECLMAEGLL
ncbi:MAG: hypothetical protein ACI3XG_05270 [Faecousia sp.]